MKRTIEEVLDEMVGANYMITAAQIEEIRDIHKCEINEALITATGLAEEAYEAGRKHDRKGFEEAVDYGRKRIRFAFGSRQRRHQDERQNIYGFSKDRKLHNEVPALPEQGTGEEN